MNNPTLSDLRFPFAARYIWWKSPEAAAWPTKIDLAQGLAGVRALSGVEFWPSASFKALTWIEGVTLICLTRRCVKNWWPLRLPSKAFQRLSDSSAASAVKPE